MFHEIRNEFTRPWRAIRDTSDERRATINMQNKPNLLNAQMNLSSVLTKDYENKRLCRCGENKANTKPIYAIGIRANLLDAQMDVSSVLTKDYENKRLCRYGENKPNQTQPVVSLSNLFQRQKNAAAYDD